MKRTFLTSVLFVSAMLAPVVGNAQDRQDKSKDESANKSSSETSTKDHSTIAADQKKRIDEHIAQLSKDVQLTDEQKEKIRTQMTGSAEKTRGLWQDYISTQMQVVGLEAHMIAAIEDTLEPEQKMKSKAKRDKQVSSREASGHQSKDQDKSDDSKRASQSEKDKSADSKNNESDKTKSESGAKSQSADAKGDRKNGASNKEDKQTQTEEVVWTMVIVPVQDSFVDLGMSDEQLSKCDAICRSYHRALAKEWDKLDALHDQLVAMEATQITDMEKILTSDQRNKLMSMKKGPQSVTSSSNDKSNDK